MEVMLIIDKVIWLELLLGGRPIARFEADVLRARTVPGGDWEDVWTAEPEAVEL